MSLTKKLQSQSSQKTRNNSVRSKSVKPVKPATSTGQKKQSAETEVKVSSNLNVDKTEPEDNNVRLIHTGHHQREFLIECYFDKNDQSQQEIEGNSRKTVLRNAITKLQADIRKREKDLFSLPLIQEEFQKALIDAEQKIQLCERFENEVKDNYASMLIFITEKIKAIGDTHDEANAIVEATINQQKLFDRESELGEQKLDKVNTQIEFVTNKRDETAMHIAEANKITSEMTNALHKLRKSNKELKEQIDKKRNEKESIQEALANLNDNITLWINEKNETLQQMKKEKAELKKIQASLLVALDDKKDQCKDLDNECNELSMKTADQEKLIARVKTANKNLYNDEESKLEFNENRSLLSEKLKKLKDNIAGMENERDIKQKQLDHLKRMSEEISKKQQNHRELQSNLTTLKEENMDILEKVTNVQKNINEMKSSEIKERQDAAVISTKRIRLSSISSTDERLDADIVSNVSSINLKDLGIDSEFGSELDSFNRAQNKRKPGGRRN